MVDASKSNWLIIWLDGDELLGTKLTKWAEF